MNIKVLFTVDDSDVGRERAIEILIDERRVFDVFEDDPEDMTFYRTLKDCLKVPELLERAYKAGKAGEEFVLEKIAVNKNWEVIHESD
jgi:hypothetical protein